MICGDKNKTQNSPGYDNNDPNTPTKRRSVIVPSYHNTPVVINPFLSR